VLGIYSCSNDDVQDIPVVPEDQTVTPEPEGNSPDPQPEEGEDVLGTVEFINPERVDDNYILVNDAGANRAYIMDKQARLLHEWTLTNKIGNDVFLLPDGRVLASLESDEPKINIGGKGGQLQFIGPDNTVEWKFLYSSELAETHHDAELLPNGNVIAMVWEKRTAQEASDGGCMVSIDLYPETIIEIDPNTDEIVWEWHSWEHLIQDYDDSKSNFGVVADHPELIDINYVPKSGDWPEEDGDIMHANAISYDPVNDLIFLSVNFFSEVWVIDHSTTTEEATGHSGGAYGKGGDLIYRFGNPEAYQNPAGSRRFYNNHFPNLLQGADQGKLLIFSNGKGFNQSTVYELQLPDKLELNPYADNEPEVLWSFTDEELYSGKVSGAVPLENGNILITEGDYGFWEVTREKEVVWKFNGPGFFWRGYSFDREATEIQALGL
jgi:hypothetical protein